MSEINKLKYYYKPIEYFGELKKSLRLIKTSLPEIYENMTKMLNDIDNLVNFIEKFNEQINALNIINNTKHCNALLQENSNKDISNKQKEYNQLLTKEQVAINNIQKEIDNFSIKAIKDSSFKYKNKYIYDKLIEQKNLFKNKEKVSIFDYFKKKSILKKCDTEIKDVMLIKDSLEQDIISIKRKTNFLLDFNKEKEKTAKIFLDKYSKDTLICNDNLFECYKTNNKELHDYYCNELYENLINTSNDYMKSKQINENIDLL